MAVVVLHTVLLACYTFPEVLVPEKLRVLGQVYARPLFHQQWRLFAPDPPLCSCELQWRSGQREWATMEYRPDTYLHRRTLQSLARHVQAEVQHGDTVPAEPLVRAMHGIVYHGSFDPGRGHAMPEITFRLVEHCVVDPRSPAMRERRVTVLNTP